jgi:hypothetical protein
MKTKPRRSVGRRQATLFDGRTPTVMGDPAMRRAVVDALAELLLEAARPPRPSRSTSDAGGQDDESEDHG